MRKTVFWYIFLLIHPSNKSSQLKMHFWRETTEHVDVYTSNYIKAWKFSFKNFNFPFLTLYFLTPKAEQADGEALLCMNKETLKTLVPPAGVRAKFLHKIRKLDDKSMEVRIIHEVSTEVCTEKRDLYLKLLMLKQLARHLAPRLLIKRGENLFTLPKGQSQTSFH